MPPGCFAILTLFLLIFLVPFFLTHAMFGALSRLGLSPGLALMALTGIFIGGLINIPVKKIEQEHDLYYQPFLFFGLDRILPGVWSPAFRSSVRTYMVISVNVGGCLIPSIIAVYEVFRVASLGSYEAAVLLFITGVNIAVCYFIARPIPNVGISMPALVPPLAAAFPALILVPGSAAPVAFTAGVLGPLIGTDLLHLKDINLLKTGVVSIGGAGTFDGIVLSGMIAALLA